MRLITCTVCVATPLRVVDVHATSTPSAVDAYNPNTTSKGHNVPSGSHPTRLSSRGLVNYDVCFPDLQGAYTGAKLLTAYTYRIPIHRATHSPLSICFNNLGLFSDFPPSVVIFSSFRFSLFCSRLEYVHVSSVSAKCRSV
ncbi:hypothetical protein F5141DRAFT_1106819 [Pisolithus sp. B1]|nr:hypothetical protein F5141DRAFT_1106819 [Pisolithus sp. B1]